MLHEKGSIVARMRRGHAAAYVLPGTAGIRRHGSDEHLGAPGGQTRITAEDAAGEAALVWRLGPAAAAFSCDETTMAERIEHRNEIVARCMLAW